MKIKKNDKIKLNIESFTNEGSAVGHYNGIAIFVRGAVPGDEIITHIIKTSKNYCIGVVDTIITASNSRIESDCPVSSKCGGCSCRNMTYDEELKYKLQRVNDAIHRIGHIDSIDCTEIIGANSDEQCHYRNKAQYPVEIKDGKLFAGFYAYKSHRIIPCNDCLLQPKEFEQLLTCFEKYVEKSNITSYDDKTCKGLLRHIYFRKGFATNEIMVCAVINGNKLPMSEYLIELLTKNENVKSICININKAKTNVILGNKTKVIYGSQTITDELLGNKFVISPNSFYQVNHNQCEKLYEKAIEYADLNKNKTVIDLYCGAGTIGLSMAKNAKAVYGVEIIEQAIENAKINAKINEINNAEFFCGDAYDALKQLQNRNITPDILVLDPPRKGCQSELFDVIEKMNPQSIVYVSCDPATLARDMNILNQKHYIPTKITAVDLFPRTTHVETVVKLVKN